MGLVIYEYKKDDEKPHKYTVTINDYFHCFYCNKTEKMNMVAHIESDSEIKFVDNKVKESFSKTCKKCKCDMYIIDEEVFDAIIKLNKKGYNTKFSCEGHSFNVPAYIAFDEDFTDEDVEKFEAPEHWFWDKGDSIFRFHTLRTLGSIVFDTYFEIKKISFEEYKKEYLKSLYDWIDSLPYKGGESNV